MNNINQKKVLCRICAKAIKNVTSCQNLFGKNRTNFLQLIEALTGILLKASKDLPENICEKCQQDLEQAQRFRQRCLKSQQYFITEEYKRLFVQTEEYSKDDEEEKEVEFIKVDSIKEELIPNNFLAEEIYIKAEPEDNLFLANNFVHSNEIFKSPKSSETGKVIGERTVNGSELNPSKKRREKKFFCDKCGNHISGYQKFCAHIRRHNGDRPFQCEFCVAKFFSKGELKIHERQHTGERPYPCRHCDRPFADTSSRIRHERTHTNTRPYSCQQCNKAFTATYLLKTHMLVHTRERAFECTACNKFFLRRTHLTTHYGTISHKENEQKILKLENLKKHNTEEDMLTES